MIITRNILLLIMGFSACDYAAYAQVVQGRELTIERCYSLARENYPLIRQRGLIEQTKAYSIENAAKGYWPQLQIVGQASYQSAVTTLPVDLPDVQLPSLSKDQYRLYGELIQTVYENGVIRRQQQITEAQARTEQQQAEAALYGLRERINQLYFGILMTDVRLTQTALLSADIQSALDKVEAAIRNGTALKSQADVLRAQLLQTGQRRIELMANRRAYSSMLSLFIGEAIGDSTVFAVPQVPALNSTISRPELRIYEFQKAGLYAQQKLLKARTGPRLGLFLQGGVGRPGLNFLSNQAEPYYIGGLRLNWNFGGYYTLKRDRQMLDLAGESIDMQRDIFLFNTELGLTQVNEEIRKLQAMLAMDEEIVTLRARVKSVSAAQLANGITTVSDYLREVNAEDQAKLDLGLHRLQLLMAQFNYRTSSGN